MIRMSHQNFHTSVLMVMVIGDGLVDESMTRVRFATPATKATLYPHKLWKY